ncbi:hypothetical protein N7519_006238 [Penicillium mononematosum]|uniref:uncharacterized protein n=1 Tax=Penicillium mononematosum TaxID=268346 RepID=UPI0025483026|nr:uncharacterized protein N7519_006238 [Penicillium mononematosum]KAJ6184937.1 hypothetical protein N7519_006238 [Penicillium mononematosum]
MNNHNESSASERSPLLQDSINVDVDVSLPLEIPHTLPPRLKRRVILLLYSFAFFMMLGDNLQPAALIQIFENVICDDYYSMHALPSALDITASPTSQLADRCKAQAVQKEVALVRGFHQLVPVFAAVLCTVPYGLLAERVGRKRVLFLSGAGVLAALSWVLAVCYWRFVSIRWVWLSGAFLFIGGGDAVTSSVVHIMVTDATVPAERAQIFLFLHAADVISGFLGPALSAALMEKGYTWTVLLLAEGVLCSGIILLTQFIPETLNLKEKLTFDTMSPQVGQSCPRRLELELSSSTKAATNFFAQISALLAPLLGVLTSNPQALLLLCIFAPQTAARDLFTMIGLQYSSAKYSLPYSRGNVLLSVFQGAQGLCVLVLLPLITHFIADRRGWTAWAPVAPALAIEATGLLLVAVGSCTTGFLMSLLGAAVQPGEVSAVYSAALMLSIVVRSLMGPVASMLFVKGLELGWHWMGLPFAAAAVLMTGMAIASGFICLEKKDPVEVHSC